MIMSNFVKINLFPKAVFALLILASFASHAGSIQKVSIEQLLDVAELVFEGEVIASRSQWNDNKSAIHTFITFKVDDVIIGEYGSNRLELRFLGGEADGAVMEADGSVFPEVGEAGIYFVESTTQYLVNPLAGWSQGHFLINKQPSGDEVMMTNEGKTITDIEDNPVVGSEFSTGTAAGVDVARYVTDLPKGMKKKDFKLILKNKKSKIRQK